LIDCWLSIFQKDDDTTAVKVSIKLATGKAISRRYRSTDTVRCLFAVATDADPENRTRPFDLISRFPAKNLSNCLDQTLQEAGLAGVQVFHRWLA
jgi:hypothetical protein